MSAKQYTWESPNAWLLDKINEWDVDDLRDAFRSLVTIVDSDTIQDTFQPDMEKDGYFIEGGEA